MAITTTNLKAAIEAKIAAATSGTSLEDLTVIKADADLFIKSTSTAITGYASLEALIQTKENALTGSSTLDDITLTGVAAFPPAASSGGGSSVVWKMVDILSSTTWVAPAALAGGAIYVDATAGGGSGARDGTNKALGGFGGEFCTNRPFTVSPSQSLTVTVGAGGLFPQVNLTAGGDGGDTIIGSLLTLKGGSGGRAVTSGTRPASPFNVGGTWPSFAPEGTSFLQQAERTPHYKGGGNSGNSYGGGAGLFGPGGHGSSTLEALAPNTGAGGGGGGNNAADKGGSSGRVIIRWQEFV